MDGLPFVLAFGFNQGDYRCLYLGWLLALQQGEVDDDTLEPLVPHGLKKLSAQLETLVQFLNIDPDLVQAAAEQSSIQKKQGISPRQIKQWVKELSLKEKDNIIVSLLGSTEPNMGMALRDRACREIGQNNAGSNAYFPERRRSASEIIAQVDEITIERQQRQSEARVCAQARQEQAAAEQRRKYLLSLQGKERHLWSKVEMLIQTKQPNRYDEAVTILQDLNDLADVNEDVEVFNSHLDDLFFRHRRKTSFLNRLKKANLLTC